MSQEAQIIMIYVPCGSEDEAAGIASALLSERLIACANIYESRSLYMWEGKLADQKEYVLFAKTTPALVSKAEQRIGELHSYEVPCILAIRPDSVSDAYARWVAAEVASDADRAAAIRLAEE
jgi:periplasmic divalent cation tolerance protein